MTKLPNIGETLDRIAAKIDSIGGNIAWAFVGWIAGLFTTFLI